MKLLKWFFNFGAKYRKKEEQYFHDSRRYGPFWNLITVIAMAAVPLLLLWGAFELPWSDNAGIFKIICIILSFLTLFIIPSELAIWGVVAFRHAIYVKVNNKVTETTEEIAEKISSDEISGEIQQQINNHKEKSSNFGWDIAIGIIGLVAAVGVVIAYVGWVIGWLSAL